MKFQHGEKPLLYDVYCGAGGTSKGYQEAGFYVVGIDSEPQPRYIGDAFIQMNAFDFFMKLHEGDYPSPTLISTSPPLSGLHKAALYGGQKIPSSNSGHQSSP